MARYAAGEPFGGWEHTEDLWVHGYWYYEWNDRWEKVERLDAESRSVTARAALGVDGGVGKANRFVLLNSLDALDAAGEYYIDRTAGRLYFFPPRALRPSDRGWVSVQSSALLTMDASHVILDSLHFDGGRGDAIMVAADGVTISNCTVTNMGNAGVSASGSDLQILGNLVRHMGGKGIDVGGGDTRTLRRANNLVADNLVADVQRLCFTYQPGISAGGVGSTIAHNEVSGCRHTGMGIGGNDILWELNKVHDVIRECWDCGALCA
jgi:hypothetical protein